MNFWSFQMAEGDRAKGEEKKFQAPIPKDRRKTAWPIKVRETKDLGKVKHLAESPTAAL